MTMKKNEKSLLRLSTAAMFAGVLVLAGCGGGGGTPPTGGGQEEEQQCADNEIYDNGECKSADDLRGEGAQNRDRERENEMAKANVKKLFDGISEQMGDGDLTNLEANDRDAGYNTAGTAILVSIGGESPATAAITLSEDEDTMVTALHGWKGKRYTAEPANDGTYEANVYSYVGKPTKGKKFNAGYTLTEGRTAAIDTAAGLAYDGGTPSPTDTQKRIAFTGVTRSAGTETFKLPEPNPSGETNILIPGSFHGVSGTYRCVPSTPADGCSASVSAEGGFTLAAGTWTFKPANPEATVADAPDTSYASYGWWLHKDGNTWTASAFVDERGTGSPAASGLNTLNGKATYSGGAAGKYALQSTTGGKNAAGHFTAKASLEANFTDNMIKGKIDNFMGETDGMSSWSVELMEQGVGDTGTILGDDGTGAPKMTKWTIGEDTDTARGSWTGSLRENGDDGVPGIATGTFYSEYGTAGRMVGAFGAKKDKQ